MSTNCEFFINKKNEGHKYPLEEYFDTSIFNFHKTLPGYSPTPLFEIRSVIPEMPCNNIYLKDESRRFSIGAFKSLGASWAMKKFLSENTGEFTFCSATDGNHGRAVAWSSKIFGQKAKIFMPVGTVESRIKFIEDEGAEVTVINGNYDEAVKTALKESRKKNHVLLQDTSWTGYEHYPELISAGYTTILKEIENQLLNQFSNSVDFVILQSGVGSWAASTILYLALFHKNKNIKTIILEPFESDCLLESAKSNRRTTTLKSQNTIMAGLNCGTPSLSAWKIISDLVDAFISIDDSWAEEAIRILHRAGIESCESGAAGLGGLLALYNLDEMAPLREKLKITSKSRFLTFNTEGITDPDMHKKIIEGYR